MAIKECERAADATCEEQKQQANTPDSLSSRISQVFEGCDNAVFGVDAHGLIGYWNPQCAELLGLPRGANIQGKHSSDLLCGGDRRCDENDCTCCPVNRNMQSEEQINDFDLTLCRSDGTTIRVNISSCYFYQADDREISTYFTLGIVADPDTTD